MTSENDSKKTRTAPHTSINEPTVHTDPAQSSDATPSLSGLSSASADNQLLAIYPPLIPGLKIPVTDPENPVGGISLLLVSTGFLLLFVDPWVKYSAGDRASVLLSEFGPEIVGRTILPGEDTNPQRFTLELPAALLRNGINRIYLRVTRLTQGPETSLPLVVLFYTPRAGGEVSGGGDNPNLIMTLPADVIANGLDAARAAQGVDVSLRYIHMRAYDVITLHLDGRERTHTVTAAEALAGLVVIRLFAEAFWQDNAQFVMKFRVTDQIDNSSGPVAIWSGETRIDVHIRQPVLDLIPPKVLDALDAGGAVLNFVRDFYYAEFARVSVTFPGARRGMTVKVYWVGRKSTYGSEIQEMTSDGQTLQFLVSRNEVVDCISADARIFYSVRLPGTTQNIYSRELTLRVTSQKYHLGEPTLNTEKDNLRMYYPATLDGPYKVRMRLIGIQVRDGAEVVIAPGSTYTNYAIPLSWRQENQGRTVLLNYTLKHTGTAEPLIFSWLLRVIM